MGPHRIGRSPHASGRRTDYSFRCSGAREQGLGPFSPWNAQIGAKGGNPRKIWSTALVSIPPMVGGCQMLGIRLHLSPHRSSPVKGGHIPRPPPHPYPPRPPPPPPQPPVVRRAVEQHPYPPMQGVVSGGWVPQGGVIHPMGPPLAMGLAALSLSGAVMHSFAASLQKGLAVVLGATLTSPYLEVTTVKVTTLSLLHLCFICGVAVDGYLPTIW